MSSEYWPTLSADGRLIFFESGRELQPDGGACGNDRARTWSASRVNTATDFGTPRIDSIFSVDAGFVESSPYLHPGGRSLYFVSLGRPGPGGQDISLDEKTLFLARDQARGRDVWVAHRSSPGASFGPPQRVAGLDALDVDEIPAWLSDDLCRLYFTSNRNPADASPNLDYRLWVAERARK